MWNYLIDIDKIALIQTFVVALDMEKIVIELNDNYELGLHHLIAFVAVVVAAVFAIHPLRIWDEFEIKSRRRRRQMKC